MIGESHDSVHRLAVVPRGPLEQGVHPLADWTTPIGASGRRLVEKWLGIEDSNLGYLIQSQAAYH